MANAAVAYFCNSSGESSRPDGRDDPDVAKMKQRRSRRRFSSMGGDPIAAVRAC